jgi:hypothetical protein
MGNIGQLPMGKVRKERNIKGHGNKEINDETRGEAVCTGSK